VRDCNELADAVSIVCDRLVTDVVILSVILTPILPLLMPLLACVSLGCCCYCFICRSSFRSRKQTAEREHARGANEPTAMI